MLETREFIEPTPKAVERGHKSCKGVAKAFFRDWIWMIGNLPAERKRGMQTLLTHLVRAVDFLDLESPNALPLDVWVETRDDVNDALNGKCTAVDLAALAETISKFQIPKQFLFDMLDGVDWWTRRHFNENFDDLQLMAYRIGGAAMVAAIPILGEIKPGYETAAIRCGQAVFLTQAVANLVENLKRNVNLIPRADFESCEVDVSRLRLRKYSKSLDYLVRLHCSRIEKLFYEAGHLIEYLDFDGVRSVTSLLAYHWKILVKMRIEPKLVLNPEGVLTSREKFLLKTQHLLGLEGNIPIIPESSHH